MVNDEFGEIIKEDEATETEIESRQEERQDEVPAQNENVNQVPTEAERSKRPSFSNSNVQQNPSDTPSPHEQDLLADYLAYGLSLNEAREAHKKEQELAELKHKMRENKRAIQRGAINKRGAQTRIGPTTTPSGRGRGLTFN